MKLITKKGYYEKYPFFIYEPLTRDDFIVGEWENKTKPYAQQRSFYTASSSCVLTMKKDVYNMLVSYIEMFPQLSRSLYEYEKAVGSTTDGTRRYTYTFDKLYARESIEVKFRGPVNIEKRQAKLDKESSRINEYINEHGDKIIDKCISDLNDQINGFVKEKNYLYTDKTEDLFLNPLERIGKEYLIKHCNLQSEEEQMKQIKDKIYELNAQLTVIENKINQKIAESIINDLKEDDKVEDFLKEKISTKLKENGIKKPSPRFF